MTSVPVFVLLAAIAHGQAAAPPPQQQATPTPTPAATPAAQPADYTFTTPAGLLIFHVDPTKAADFDAILQRVKDALLKTDTQSRKLQATNWLMYKSAEKPGDSVPYLFVFDPAIQGASYDPLLLLAEVLPRELQSLFERMKAAVLRVERMGLTKIR